jgi:hypothetical protein
MGDLQFAIATSVGNVFRGIETDEADRLAGDPDGVVADSD